MDPNFRKNTPHGFFIEYRDYPICTDSTEGWKGAKISK